MASRLTSLQLQILGLLTPVTPPWRLTGGGALVGAYTGHRTTRDLDLFWCEAVLGTIERQVEALLRSQGLTVERAATSPTHVRLLVSSDGDQTIVDLVADPVPALIPPLVVTIGGIEIPVDAPHEILVNKLCALLSRSELRDLADVIALRDLGLDLTLAVQDAPRKDAGFSPLTLVWVLRNLEVVRLGRLEGWEDARVQELEASRHEIIDVILGAVAGTEE